MVDGLETMFGKLEDINMASTTSSGPIKAGTIANTTGTTLGDNVKNVGQVVMTQSSDVALTHAINYSDCFRNYYSCKQLQIINIDIVREAVFTGSSTTTIAIGNASELQQTLQQLTTFLLQQ